MSLALAFTAAAFGAVSTRAGWYEQLTRPGFAPEPWVFGPVWLLLYASMAFAAWWVWRTAGWHRARLALGLYLVQLALNAAWTPIFFGMHAIGAAFVEIVVLWLGIAATMGAFWRIRRGATFLMLPYFGWVTFAAALNFRLWQLNP